MTVSLPLPTEELYCPKLACTVFDNIFLGWNQPMVGVFTIPIGQYMTELKEERARETQMIEHINDALAEILGDGAPGVQNFGKQSNIAIN
jgi:hypothetical protein